MSIEKIKKDYLKARKEKDKERTGVLSALISEINAVGKNDGNRETTDKEALKVIQKFKKGTEENIRLNKCSEDKFSDMCSKLSKELQIYQGYLPKQMSEDEIVTSIGIFLHNNSDANQGQVMKYLKENFEGLYDGKMASDIVRKILNTGN